MKALQSTGGDVSKEYLIEWSFGDVFVVIGVVDNYFKTKCLGISPAKHV
jgi:hypothetical protein